MSTGLSPVSFRRPRALSVLLAGPAGAADRKHPAKPEPQTAPADREAVNHARESTACLKLAERAPDAAFDSALTWEDRGGGDMARLCQAMALFHQGQFQAAATRLEDLVPTLGSNTAEGASSLLARAGWAWLRAGNTDRAERAYGAALERTPRDPELLIDRAFARAEAGRHQDAVADLNRAIELAPNKAEAVPVPGRRLPLAGQPEQGAGGCRSRAGAGAVQPGSAAAARQPAGGRRQPGWRAGRLADGHQSRSRHRQRPRRFRQPETASGGTGG